MREGIIAIIISELVKNVNNLFFFTMSLYDTVKMLYLGVKLLWDK